MAHGDEIAIEVGDNPEAIPTAQARQESFVVSYAFEGLVDEATRDARVNRVVTTDALGNPATALSFNGADYPTAGKSGYDQRLIQLGFKYSF